MATKSYSKHKEYKEYSTSGNIPYTDEQFDMIKSELLPKGSKLDSLGRSGTGAREYHYEYKEEKHPSGKYDRKDLHTVEEYSVPPKSVPKSSEHSSYYYEREERDLPALNTSTGTRTYNYETTTNSSPGYSKIKTSKVTKDLSQNVGELDSLLDDLQRDQERQLYKSGYTSDTAESTSFDYKRPTPVKAPSSGYSTLKREERLESSSWGSSPPPPPTTTRAAELRQEMYREEKTESRVIPSQISPAVPIAVPPAVCTHCHHAPTGTLSRSGTPMNKVTTTVKTYTYEVPADQDPTTVPLPPVADTHHSYVSSENLRTTATVPLLPVADTHHSYVSSENLRTTTNTLKPVPSPVPVGSPGPGGCQYCSHCNHTLRDYSTIRTHVTTTNTDERNDHMVYPIPVNETKLVPAEPHNGHGPYGPTTYKYSETSYSSHNTHERFPRGPSPPRGVSPAPFPRPTTPSPGNQQPPKRLDDLLADFPEARFPTQPDGVTRRRVEVTHESSRQANSTQQRDLSPTTKPTPPIGSSKNVVGPAVYYPPGHTPFAKKDPAPGTVSGYQSSAMQQGGGAYASGRGMYEYESGSRMKEKHSERKTAVPICLPLCCAMPCVIL